MDGNDSLQDLPVAAAPATGRLDPQTQSWIHAAGLLLLLCAGGYYAISRFLEETGIKVTYAFPP